MLQIPHTGADNWQSPTGFLAAKQHRWRFASKPGGAPGGCCVSISPPPQHPAPCGWQSPACQAAAPLPWQAAWPAAPAQRQAAHGAAALPVQCCSGCPLAAAGRSPLSALLAARCRHCPLQLLLRLLLPMLAPAAREHGCLAHACWLCAPPEVHHPRCCFPQSPPHQTRFHCKPQPLPRLCRRQQHGSRVVWAHIWLAVPLSTRMLLARGCCLTTNQAGQEAGHLQPLNFLRLSIP